MTLPEACRVYLDTKNMAPMRKAVVGETGPLAQAARDMLKGGRHKGPCRKSRLIGDRFIQFDSYPCIVHLEHYWRRRDRLAELVMQLMVRP